MKKGSFDASDGEMEVEILGERILVTQENVQHLDARKVILDG